MSLSIYEIEQEIMALVDPETGEITDYDALDKLNMERETKIENIAMWIKNLTAEAKAIREEEKSLAERRKSNENKAESLEKYLDRALNGDKFSTAKVAISYRKSNAVEITDEESFIKTADVAYIVPQAPKIDRKAISDALKAGAVIEGATLIERNNIQIK